MTEDQKLIGALRASLKEAERLRRHNAQLLSEIESVTSEPVAVVGVGCRFPGGVVCGDDLWGLVVGGRDV
ncbi:polyketide synthase docking domain-containing protein, partial [Nocardia xishanensis]